MTEDAPAPAAAAPVKASKKKAVTKPKKVGASVGDLIVDIISASKERGGVSFAAVKKGLAAKGYNVEKNNSRIKVAIKSLVAKETLVQTKGTGASGSFKLNKKAAEKLKPVKKVTPKGKKPAADKKAVAKKAAVKKILKPVTPKAKKRPNKTKKTTTAAKKPAKSPKKIKKPAKSPKKIKKPVAATKSPQKAKVLKRKVGKAKKPAPKKK